MRLMKIISWNVNGIRAWNKKGCWNFIEKQSPDFLCVQETKAESEQLDDGLRNPKGYFSYFNSSKERKGHSGTAIYAKKEPIKVTYGLGISDLDNQGRQINLFYKDFVLINCYFPNGGGPIERLLFKLRYYEQFLKFINKLRKDGYKIIFCGDVNVAHEEIDIARPKENENKVGFLREERDWVDEVILNDYIDTFREIYPQTVRYSWWDVKTRARDRNIGWRIDYFFVDKSIFKKVKKAEIFDDILGSDHAPCLLEINF
jgi:exodeoxyribonuclease-3